ncbi:hypothetical protein GmRootV118_02890 [Variovorax sp. V118]|uniref:hypothetical protein n=1 Tax=Variovorax sp. V118 TaxID=3065954 RepID=UPI0034E86477
MKMKYIEVVPRMSAPVVDHLAYILPLGIGMNGVKYEKLMLAINRRVKSALTNGECKTWYPRGNRYKMAIEFRPSADTSIKIGIGATRKEVQNGDIRISLNPSRLTKEDVKRFHAFMQEIIGKRYADLLSAPLINRIDVAVDIVDLELDRLLVRYAYAQRHTVIIKRLNGKGRVEGFNLGSVSSDYFTAVYDKSAELLDKAVKQIARRGSGTESTKSVAIKQLKAARGNPPTVRVEVRGRKVRGKSVREVLKLTDRFERLNFVALDAELAKTIRRSTLELFVSACRDRGVKAALELFEGDKSHTKLKALWTNKPTWWTPDKVWRRAVKGLKSLGIFADDTFKKPSKE